MIRGLVLAGCVVDMARYNRAEYLCGSGTLTGPVSVRMFQSNVRQLWTEPKRTGPRLCLRHSGQMGTLTVRADQVERRYVQVAFVAWEGSTLGVIPLGHESRMSSDPFVLESYYPRCLTAADLLPRDKVMRRLLRTAYVEHQLMQLIRAAVTEGDEFKILVAADWLEEHGYGANAELVRNDPKLAMEEARTIVRWYAKPAPREVVQL